MGTPLPLAQLNSLDLLRGFVAAGRRMSITLAAQDLSLTQSAVSRQIRELERRLGTPLLRRGHRSIAFTPAGERLFRGADAALRQLQDLLGDVRSSSAARPVTLSASVGFTGLWLLPRLGRLHERHPGVDLRVAANNRLVDLRDDGVDLAIRYTSPQLAPSGAVRLFGETIAPVAHPSLRLPARLSARGLAGLTLLEFDDPLHPWLQWRSWLEANALANAAPREMLHFNHYDLAIQAALAGHGVALGRLELIQPLLDDGRLVRFDAGVRRVETSHAYWLIQAEAAPRRAVRTVAAWLRAEAAPG